MEAGVGNTSIGLSGVVNKSAKIIISVQYLRIDKKRSLIKKCVHCLQTL